MRQMEDTDGFSIIYFVKTNKIPEFFYFSMTLRDRGGLLPIQGDFYCLRANPALREYLFGAIQGDVRGCAWIHRDS
jgi:hypothetical protein